MADTVDWDALAADVLANFAATGRWFATGARPLPEPPVDWDALAAQVLANFAATGQWFLGAPARTITLVSTASDGSQRNFGSFDPIISDDGRYAVFQTYGEFQIFRKDLEGGVLDLVSANAEGVAGNDTSVGAYDMTPDGRYVVFSSQASNLVPDDINGHTADVFVRDMRTGAVRLVSTDGQGRAGDGASGGPSISDDGRTVAFGSSAGSFMPESAGPPRQYSATTDIYVKDLETGALTLVTVDAQGNQATGPVSGYFGASYGPSLTADGQKVAFTSFATNLVPGTTPHPDVFLKDLSSGSFTLVSADSQDRPGDAWSGDASITPDGRYVVFYSAASNFAPGDTSGNYDIYVKDLQTGRLTLVSSTPQGEPGNGFSGSPAISENGRYVSFLSSASNLVPDDDNGKFDAFVKDLSTGETTLVSRGIGGRPGNSDSYTGDVTDEGDVAFASGATDLVTGDTNALFDIFLWA